MNQNPKSKDKLALASKSIEKVFEEVAEKSIVKMIITGSGGPENLEISESGLRFVRFLLSRQESHSTGIMPNFKDLNYIHTMARDYIRECGTASKALKLMQQNS